MSKIEYLQLDDPLDQNFGTYAPLLMFGSGLVRDGSSTTYMLTGRGGVSLYFEGEDFDFDGRGRPTAGHATSITIVLNGEALATVTDVDIGFKKLAALDTAKEFYDLLGKMNAAGSAFDDVIYAQNRDNILRGNDGDDTLFTGKGDDKLYGGDGDDAIVLGGGKDYINGGAGLDIVGLQFDDKIDLKVDLNINGYQKVFAGQSVKLISIEGVYGANGDDELIGDAQANRFSGAGGHDLIRGADGDDTISGGAGNDTLTGGFGEDTVSFLDATRGVRVSLAETGVQNTGQGKDRIAGFENLTGSYYDDRLTGTSEFNHIEGGQGDDTIIGGGGRDGLFGGYGDDVFLFTNRNLGLANIANIGDFNDFGDKDLLDVSAVDANANLAGNQDFIFIGAAEFTGVAGELRWSYFGGDTTRDILVTGDTNGDKLPDFFIQLIAPVSALTAADFDL